MESGINIQSGSGMYALMKELFPIFRSITGSGVRKSLGIIKNHIPIEIHEVPSGTKAFDWEVPREWNITQAYIEDDSGKRIVDIPFRLISGWILRNYSPICIVLKSNQMLFHILLPTTKRIGGFA